MSTSRFLVSTLASLCLLTGLSSAQTTPGEVLGHSILSDTQGGFGGGLADQDQFGRSVTPIGDLDFDGTTDLAVGAWQDSQSGLSHGAVWILFMQADGTVRESQKITDGVGGFTGTLDTANFFGEDVAPLGDLDLDGTPDLAVSSGWDDAGGSNRGAIWILFMNWDGTVKSHQKISSTEGGFGGTLADEDHFGTSLTNMGDLDQDGKLELAVGAWGDDAVRGAAWILSLNSDGTVDSEQKIAPGIGGFTGSLAPNDSFGLGIANIGDLNDDGVNDLVTGANLDNDGGSQRGAAYVLFLNTDGTVNGHQKISSTQGGLSANLDDDDFFGIGVGSAGDLDGDAVEDLIVTAVGDDDAAADAGAIYHLFMNTDGTVKSHLKVTAGTQGFQHTAEDFDFMGTDIALLGDMDGDGYDEIAIGAMNDGDGGPGRGAVYIQTLSPGTRLQVGELTPTQWGLMQVVQAEPNAIVHFLGSVTGTGPSPFMGLLVDLSPPVVPLGQVMADSAGFAPLYVLVPKKASGKTVHLQAAIFGTQPGAVTNLVTTQVNN